MASDDYDTEADVSGGEAVSEHGGLFRRLTGWYKDDITHVNEWRKEAREDFDFYAGHQWSDDELNELAAKKRPALQFNRIGPLVNAIVGSEINNRREVRYFPREAGDAQANEVLTAAAEWFRDECGAEDEESDAFKSQVIAGMGWTDTRLDFEDNPDGDPRVEKIDAMEMVWDCNSVKANLADAQRLFRVREVSYDEAVDLTGVTDKSKLHAGWVKTVSGPDGPHDQDRADKYDGTQSDLADGSYRKKCVLVEARWLEREDYYRGPDPANPQNIKDFTVEEYEGLSAEHEAQFGQPFPAKKFKRKVVRRAFIGSEVLGKPDKPLVPRGMFGWECITGYKDETKNQWYGVVRAAKDPQRWANKFFSQVQFLLNSQAKGGIIAERGAFEDDRQAELSLAKSDQITWANAGALSGERPKIMPKNPAQFPAGFFTLFQESKEAINDVTGLSMEFIGTREVDQAGVLEHQRRQSSLNLLAELFNSLRRYRKRQGRELLHLIQNHLSDGRLIRIVGDELTRYVPLSREQLADGEYDIIVDDSPSSPNEKERTWQLMMQLLPIIKDMLTPEIALELMEFSPFPASFVEKLRQRAVEAAAQPKPPSPEEQKMQAQAQKHQLDMAGKQMDLQANQAKIGMELQADAIELHMKQQEMQMDAARDRQKLEMDMRKLALQERANAIRARQANTARTRAAQ